MDLVDYILKKLDTLEEENKLLKEELNKYKESKEIIEGLEKEIVDLKDKLNDSKIIYSKIKSNHSSDGNYLSVYLYEKTDKEVYWKTMGLMIAEGNYQND